MKKRFLIINSLDNVGVILNNVKKSDVVCCAEVKLVALDNIDFAHKIALVDINKGDTIIKYGESIGYALTDIKKGGWVHIHNMDCERAREERIIQ